MICLWIFKTFSPACFYVWLFFFFIYLISWGFTTLLFGCGLIFIFLFEILMLLELKVYILHELWKVLSHYVLNIAILSLLHFSFSDTPTRSALLMLHCIFLSSCYHICTSWSLTTAFWVFFSGEINTLLDYV